MIRSLSTPRYVVLLAALCVVAFTAGVVLLGAYVFPPEPLGKQTNVGNMPGLVLPQVG